MREREKTGSRALFVVAYLTRATRVEQRESRERESADEEKKYVNAHFGKRSDVLLVIDPFFARFHHPPINNAIFGS